MKKKHIGTSQPEFNKKPQKRYSDQPNGFSNVIELSPKQDSEIKTAKAVAKKLNIPFVDPLRAHIEPAAIAKLDQDIAFETQSIPVRLVNDKLLVAMATPNDEAQITILKLFTSCNIRPAAAPKSSVATALQTVYEKSGQKTFKNTQVKGTLAGDKGAFAVSIISNKGGVGKTHFSVNLAYALSASGAKVLLIDADLGNADISNKLGIFPKQNLLDFLQNKQNMQEIVVRTEFNFDLICSKYGDFKLANLNYPQKIKFLKHFKSLRLGYDFVLFDLGAGISRTVLDFALAVDRTVIVTTPQDIISGYACAKACFFRFKEIEENLEARLQDYKPICRFDPMLVVNKVDHIEDGRQLYNTINKTADENININEDRFRIDVEYLGSIPYDRKIFKTAELKKRPLLHGAPHTKVSECIRHISKKFIKTNAGDHDPILKSSSPFRRLFGIFTQRT